MEKNEKAITFFSESLALNHYQIHVYFRRALTYFCEDDFAAALKDLDVAAALGLSEQDEKNYGQLLQKK